MTVNDADVDYAVDLIGARYTLCAYIRLMHWVLSYDNTSDEELDAENIIQHLHDEILFVHTDGSYKHMSEYVRIVEDEPLENMLDEIIRMGAETYAMNSIRGRNLKSHVHRIWRELEELGDK